MAIQRAIVDEVDRLKKMGLDIQIVELLGQCFVLVRGVQAQSPPWDKVVYDILIAIPVTYPNASLDGFYLNEPHKFGDGLHPRVNGQTISLAGSTWRQVSWHYPDNHPWQQGIDTLEAHITHCRGFFLGRGAVNDYH